MGVSWERMIRTVRKVMTGLLTDQKRLSDESLDTIFCEIEYIVTKLSDDPNDHTPISPNDLLMMKSGTTLLPGHFHSTDEFRRRWRQVQYIADQFWRKWLKLYLPELQSRQKWYNVRRNLEVGDLVLICNENTPRSVWPLAIVRETVPSKDGLIRSVKVKTKSTELVRPIAKVILLECSSDSK
ncbi:Uncharacterised protein r2_g783 [Pycnogonum litorale]